MLYLPPSPQYVQYHQAQLLLYSIKYKDPKVSLITPNALWMIFALRGSRAQQEKRVEPFKKLNNKARCVAISNQPYSLLESDESAILPSSSSVHRW